MKRLIFMLFFVGLLALSGTAAAGPGGPHGKGLSRAAERELVAAGVTRYLGEFSPAVSAEIADGWVKHTFDPGLGEGPICIAGTPYSVFTKTQDPRKLLIMLQGGGACWQDFYNCNILAEDQEPPPPDTGIWSEGFDIATGTIPNPLADWSIVYLPYCDGSVFSGDNVVPDPAFQAFIEDQAGLPPGAGPPFRFHRGMRNLSAGIDIARSLLPRTHRILLAGSSAGGAGAAGFAPFITRIAFGKRHELRVFNDAGPIAVNLMDVEAIQARAADWRFGQFYPESCAECDDTGQGTEIVKWRLQNDRSVLEAFYSTDGDATNRFFLQVPTQELYRELLLTEHGAIHAEFPHRYKRFIRSGDDSHTALQSPLYFIGTANDLPLFLWVEDFVKPNAWHFVTALLEEIVPPWLKRVLNLWDDIVENFVPVPEPETAAASGAP